MSKQAPTLEWVVMENDADWARACAPSSADSPPGAKWASQERLSSPQVLWGASVMLLLLVSAGGWWWRTTQAGLQQREVEASARAAWEIAAVAQGDNRLAIRRKDGQGDIDWWYQLAQEYGGLLAATQTADPAEPLDAALRNIKFQGGQAVADVVLYGRDGALAYRQTRFYQRTSTGWQVVAPDVNLWGPVGSLETPSFVFHFRQNDAAVVIAVAPRIEELYTTLRRDVGLPVTPAPEKRIIEVSVTETPGHVMPWFWEPGRFLVPSPAVYRAPVELTDAELLAQSLALPLIAHVLAQASEQQAIRPAWQPLLNGLYLWQVWALDLPLAVWREVVVTWIYRDLPASRPGQAIILPERYAALCAAHTLWMPSPAQMNIPLLCAEPHREELILSPWGSYNPLIRLDQLAVPLRPGEYIEEPDSVHRIGYPGQAVAMATLIEYAVVTYGRERLPTLVAGLRSHDRWATLIPAVYGVSAAEFEAGWQAYLVAHYGL